MNTQIFREITPIQAATEREELVCETIRDESQFLRLKDEWEEITSQMDAKGPLHEWRYLNAWLSCFKSSAPKKSELMVLRVREDGETLAIFPFLLERKGPLSLMPSRLRPLGYAGRLEPYDLTEEPLAAITPGSQDRVLNAASRWIQQGLKRGDWDCAILKWFGDREPASTNAWIRFRRKPGPAHVSLPNDWQSFRKSLSKSMRDNLPYYPRLLSRKGHEWEIEFCDSDDAWNRAVSELVRLHRLRAYSSFDPDRIDHLAHPLHEKFLRQMRDIYREPCRAFIGLLRVDNKVVAAQLFVEDSRTLLMSYSGFDHEWASFSPLLVLQSETIKRGIDRGIARLDFLCGEAKWQERWQPSRDFPICKLVLASKRPLATVRCICYVLRRELVIYWSKCRIARVLKRKQLNVNVQSVGQAISLNIGNHWHLFSLLHRCRLHV